MVDFRKLRTQKKTAAPIEPLEIFRRLPKPPGINDLYTSQAEILRNWFQRRTDRDIVIKLHTGGGKTLVGLLIAQSTLYETNHPTLYLAPTRQLVTQAIKKARDSGIPAVLYEAGQPLDDDFINGKAIMVATYKALFNGCSKFGVRGESKTPIKVGAIIMDDAHVSFSTVRESFTLEISAEDRQPYEGLCGLFREAFNEIDRVGTFDDTVKGESLAVLEVPYRAWREKRDAVRAQLWQIADQHVFSWPLLRDNLHLCHALISRNAFTITPVLPLVNMFPTFSEAPRRIYMSATIADDSEIVRTFDADPQFVANPLVSRSLAGVSERMILVPDLMPFDFNVRDFVEKLVKWTAENQKLGAVILVPSNDASKAWPGVSFAEGSDSVQEHVLALQERASNGPVVFANRYDGIDLPGDACRVLVVDGLPAGSVDYELWRASMLYGSTALGRTLAQRIEQGIGRGARGGGDHCVVILMGPNLASWIAKEANFQLLTSATRAQLDIGRTVSEAVTKPKDLLETVVKSFRREPDWVEYHAAALAERVTEEADHVSRFYIPMSERKAFNLWNDGHHDKAITQLIKVLDRSEEQDLQAQGWMLQFAARIADHWENWRRADELQQAAFAKNRNLLRPQVSPPYRPLTLPSPQAEAIAQRFAGYHLRQGLLQRFNEVVAQLNPSSTANQFEEALVDLAKMLGLSGERFDKNGEGPDVLILLPEKIGFVVEVKSRKNNDKPLTKEEHGQLLVAEEWFKKCYPGYSSLRVSLHPNNRATKVAEARGSYALTLDKLGTLISDARRLLIRLSESELPDRDMVAECARELDNSSVRADKIAKNYLHPFVEV